MLTFKNSLRAFVITCFFPVCLFSQKEFDVKKIPIGLRTNAEAVVRLDETIFSIADIGHAKKERRFVVTVFNERGERKHATFQEGYDKLNKLKRIEGIKYDSTGAVISKLKTNEIKDFGVSSFGTDILDARVKVATFDTKQSVYPYTVEYSFEVITENMMFYPMFYPCDDEFTGIEKASLVINTPGNFTFRYKEMNGITPVVKTQQDEKNTYTWRVENLPAYEEEPNSPNFDKPFVITAPTEFEVEGYHGNISSWTDVGKFYFELNKGRDVLPEAIKAKVKSIVQSEKDIKVKIEKLYEYLQSGTHYMNISLGIGGWQTMKAEDVAKRGYGDCKALSNYMKALLNEAGIPAYQALVYAGAHGSFNFPDFASMHFNHVITCVPLEKDTIFLECTSQVNPFGYQGSFTGNRKALLILPDNGKLINTVVYKPTDNTQARTGKITVREDGSADVAILTTYRGIQQERRSGVVNSMDAEEQKDWLKEHISISSFDLLNFSFTEKKTRVPELEERLKLNVKKAVTKSGTRLFLSPNLMTTFMSVPLMDGERKTDLFLNANAYNFQDTDTLVYELPKNCVLEFLPQAVKITSRFGEYSSHSILKEGNLIYYRHVIVNSGTYPKTDFKDWVDFIKKVSKSDREGVVFKLTE
jgi:hypothetical protein